MNFEDPILIAGAGGLLGSHLFEYLIAKGYRSVFAARREDCDLVDSENVRTFFDVRAPRYVFHCAGRVYGVGGSTNNKSKTFYENMMINTNVIHAAAVTGVKKNIGSR
ncbi:NAD-dependent epimerase/dehydratase family protein [Luminiphilus sp.]|nr:NAD-dependent epimerase/dehydratase family protein [Luminiphilus sp.]